MLDEKEINLEIAKWEYLESSYENYAKLADLYTIRDQMQKKSLQPSNLESEYSAAPAAVDYSPKIELYGDSDFLKAIEGKNPTEVWTIIDDLMDTLHIVNPRVYESIIRKIRRL